MSKHPVQLRVEPSARPLRIHVLIRLVLLLAVAALGYSAVYWPLYLALPAVVAIVVMNKGGARYLREDAPRVLPVLRWLAAAYAYLWLLTDAMPSTEAGGPVDLTVDVDAGGNPPTPATALLRLIYSLPALVLVAVLTVAAGLLWLVGAAFILARERMPAAIAEFLAMTLAVQLRLCAYHLSLTDRYPSLEAAGLAPAVP
jgi:hypothetical protein